MSDDPGSDDVAEQIGLLIAARERLERAATLVCWEARELTTLELCGTDELNAALSALEAATYLDEQEDAACWVARARARACTATPAGLLQTSPRNRARALRRRRHASHRPCRPRGPHATW